MIPRPLSFLLLLLIGLSAQAADPQAVASAAALGRYQQLLDLIAEGGDVNAKNRVGKPALALAAYYGNYMCARALLGAGADPNQVDGFGNTPLMEAAAGGHPRLVRLLLSAGADPTLKNNAGQDARARAASTRRAKQIVELLPAPPSDASTARHQAYRATPGLPLFAVASGRHPHRGVLAEWRWRGPDGLGLL